MGNNVVSVLKLGRELIEAGWTQGALARNAMQEEVLYVDTHATCFCTSGAIHRALYKNAPVENYGETVDDVFDIVWDLLGDEYYPGGIALWNDNPDRTKEDVLELFDKAIAMAKERGVE